MNDVSPDAKSFVKSLIQQLTTGDGTILLAVMFISEEGRKYHVKFPHVLGCDVTFGTNAEKRPLFRASCKTMDNKNIPIINAFVPSQQRWVVYYHFQPLRRRRRHHDTNLFTLHRKGNRCVSTEVAIEKFVYTNSSHHRILAKCHL